MWSAIGTGCAAAVAVIAAAFTLWQARIAREARDAAMDQASSARESVTVARAELDRAERPEFTIEVDDHGPAIAPDVQVRMVAGPPEITVALDWTRRHVWAEEGACVTSWTPGPHTSTWSRTRPSRWGSGHGQAVMVLTTITVTSTEVGGRERSWTHHEMPDWRRPDGGL